MKYKGIIISVICFITLAIIDSKFYHNVMPDGVLTAMLVTHALMFRGTVPKRYFIFIVLFIVCFALSLPALTFNQAKEKVQESYDITITSEDNVPVELENEWNPFEPRWYYYFQGTLADDKKIYLMVDPESGRIVEMMR